jgi:hypothetical protein
MPAQDQGQELQRILASLTPDKAGILAAQLERQKLEGRGGPQIDLVLAVLRKQLRPDAAPRWPTPQRLFCVAFEDFLVDARKIKLPGRIARTSIDPVWTWLLEQGLAGQSKELVRQIAKATLDRNEPLKTKLVVQLQSEAAEAMSSALDAAPKGSQAATHLANLVGGDDAYDDMHEMALLLAHPGALAPFRTLIPQGMTDLGEDTIGAFRQLYDQCIEATPALGAYTVILAMNRLARPWEAMALVRAVSRQSQDRLLSETDMGFAGELLIADLEELAAHAAAMRPDTFDAQNLSRTLDRLAAASAGMAREMGIKRDGKWGARIQKARALAANAAHALLGRTAQEVLSAFPVSRNGSFAKGPRKPDLSKGPDPDRVSRALRWAKLLSAVKPMSAGLGYQTALQQAHDEIEATFRQYADAVLTEMRGKDPEVRATGLAFMEAQAQVAEALLGHEAATLLRRRAAAALAA